MKMLTALVLVLTMAGACLAEDDPNVQPHLFLDLNNNGVNDMEEQMEPAKNPSDQGINEVEADSPYVGEPDTPIE